MLTDCLETSAIAAYSFRNLAQTFPIRTYKTESDSMIVLIAPQIMFFMNL
ncbi:hypothetical protein [Merismopedia glauca]|nr:hypothetical protein [Merismopedia glauca]